MEIIRKNSWNKILDNMIIIGGSARSGTTIMGKIINSLQNVEYYFEPPMLTSLLLKNDKLNLNEIEELLEFYFIDNFLLDCIAGRNINLNRNDDSCILHVKEENEIKERYKHSLSRINLEKKIINTVFSFKLPEIVFHLDVFNKLYSQHKRILMHRNANDVINSLVRKKWFSDEYLYYKHPNQVYAINVINDIKIPYWVNKEDYDFWVKTKEINRCGYYYYRISEEILKFSSTSIIIDYDTFIRTPFEIFDELILKLKLTKGIKTDEILKTVKYQEKERKNIINLIEFSLRDKILKVEEDITKSILQ